MWLSPLIEAPPSVSTTKIGVPKNASFFYSERNRKWAKPDTVFNIRIIVSDAHIKEVLLLLEMNTHKKIKQKKLITVMLYSS